MYQFFIGPVLLPVTPAAFTIDIAGNNQVVTLINDGEINILHDPKLKEVAFDVLLPATATKYPFAFYGMNGKEAEAFCKYFSGLQTRKLAFPFIVAKMRPGNQIPAGYEYMLAVIESFSQKEDATNGLDVVASLKLRQYREYSTIRVDAAASTGADGKPVYKADRQRGKSFTAELNALVQEVGLEVKGAFGL